MSQESSLTTPQDRDLENKWKVELKDTWLATKLN